MQLNNEPIRYASIIFMPIVSNNNYELNSNFELNTTINYYLNDHSYNDNDDYAIDYLLSQIPSSNIIERLFSDYISNKNKLNDKEYEKYISKNDKIIECPICFNNKESVKIEKCGHEYCDDCLKKWLQNHVNTCPICRINIREDREDREDLEDLEGNLELQENVSTN